jgi:hypothetical protein
VKRSQWKRKLCPISTLGWLPRYGALINPFVGLGSLVAQYALAEPLKRLLTYRYAISGSWDEPQVLELGREGFIDLLHQSPTRGNRLLEGQSRMNSSPAQSAAVDPSFATVATGSLDLAMPSEACLKAAVIQMVSAPDLDRNLRRAEALIEEASSGGAQLVSLPSIFCLLGRRDTDKVGLREPWGKGPIQQFLVDVAKRYKNLACGRHHPHTVPGSSTGPK